MDSTIIVAVVSLIGTLGGSIITGMVSNNKTLYRISELEKKVEKHNNVNEAVTLAWTIGSALIAWWKNNSFTKKAILADEYLHDMKEEAS